jgi:hypothetical protein
LQREPPAASATVVAHLSDRRQQHELSGHIRQLLLPLLLLHPPDHLLQQQR